MRNPFSFAAFTSLEPGLRGQVEAAQRAVYADPAFRNAFREELKKRRRASAAIGAASPCTKCTSPS